MTPTIELVPGDDWALSLTLLDENGDPIDYSGYTVNVAKIEWAGGSINPVTTDLAGISSGVVALSATDTQTADMPQGALSTLTLQLASGAGLLTTPYYAIVKGVKTLSTTSASALQPGTQGIQGIQGIQGVQGVQGVQGIPGVSGGEYGLTIYDPDLAATGIATGTWVSTYRAVAAGTFDTFFAQLTHGESGDSIDVSVFVGGSIVDGELTGATEAHGPVTVEYGTPEINTGLAIVVDEGDIVAFVLASRVGTPYGLAAQIDGVA